MIARCHYGVFFNFKELKFAFMPLRMVVEHIVFLVQ